MIFRRATLDDLDEVARVIEEGRAALAALGLDQWQNGSPTRDELQSNIQAQITYVAVIDEGDTVPSAAKDPSKPVVPLEPGSIVGTLAFIDTGEPNYADPEVGTWLNDSPNTSEEAKEADRPVSFAVLHRVATSAAAVRRGVASFMLQQSAQLACERGLKSLRADTHEGNAPMQRTFEKFGMTRCCEIELRFNSNELTRKRIGYEIIL